MQCNGALSGSHASRIQMCNENRNTHVVFRKGVFKLNHNRLSLLNVFNLLEIHKPLLVKILCFPGIDNTVHTHTNDRHHVDTTRTSNNSCTHKVTSVSGIILRQLRPHRPWLPSCRGPNSYPHVCLQTQAWRTAQQKTAPSDWMDGDVRSTPTEVFRGVGHTPSEVFRGVGHTPSEVFRGVCPSLPSSEVLRSVKPTPGQVFRGVRRTTDR